MAESNQKLLKDLVLIGQIDAKLARIFAERKKLEALRVERSQALDRGAQSAQAKEIEHKTQERSYQREEKRLKEEQQKLVDRRKALATLGNYKLQEAAEREIEHSADRLGSQEEGLIALLDQLEKIKNESDQLKSAFEKMHQDFQTFEEEARATLETLEERKREATSDRAQQASVIDPASLQAYERIHQRFPMDPVVKINNSACSGCFMQVGPQVVIQITRGDALIKCRGCGRILYLAEGEKA